MPRPVRGSRGRAEESPADHAGCLRGGDDVDDEGSVEERRNEDRAAVAVRPCPPALSRPAHARTAWVGPDLARLSGSARPAGRDTSPSGSRVGAWRGGRRTDATSPAPPALACARRTSRRVSRCTGAPSPRVAGVRGGEQWRSWRARAVSRYACAGGLTRTRGPRPPSRGDRRRTKRGAGRLRKAARENAVVPAARELGKTCPHRRAAKGGTCLTTC